MASSPVQLDCRREVSSLMIKAYLVSLLLLLSVLVWSVGDAWVQYAQGIFMPAYATHFTLHSSRASS